MPRCSGEVHCRMSRKAGSRIGSMPNSYGNVPPYDLGTFSMSMNLVRVGVTSLAERMKILETVMGSNQRFTQPQTVGKNEGAPMI